MTLLRHHRMQRVASVLLMHGNLIREESLAAMGSEIQHGGLEGFGTEVGPNGMKELV